MCVSIDGCQCGGDCPDVLMDFLRWFRGGCVFGGVHDLARCSLWGVSMGDCEGFVCWLDNSLCFLGGSLVGIVACCVGFDIFDVVPCGCILVLLIWLVILCVSFVGG